MNSQSTRKTGAAWAFTITMVVAACLGSAGSADARPAYFAQFKSLYGIADGSHLDTCGVCHYRWLGSGGRNDFGTTVEQRLYLGRTIIQSLQDVEHLDPDGDGYTSGEEIMTYMTLPGYSCSTFTQAVLPPTGYDEYITPLVPTCLDPLDIRVGPLTLSALISVGTSKVMELTVFNNGSTDALDISSYDLLAGAPISVLHVSGPTAPFSIPVGSSVTIDVTFSPTTSLLSTTALRIISNDPNEGTLDVPITLVGIPDPTLPGDQRAPCLTTMASALSKYAKVQLRQWGDCYLDELAGRACNTGARDYAIGKAAAKLESVIGGAKDTTCAAAELNPGQLGFPSTCGTGCESITLSSISDVASCLVCMQDRAMEGMLSSSLGSAPPDLPSNVLASAAPLSCEKRILTAMQKGMLKMYSTLSACELAAALANEPGGTCETDAAAALTPLRAAIDASIDKCSDTTGLLGCRFEGMSPDATCLGTAAQSLSLGLTNTTFGLY